MNISPGSRTVLVCQDCGERTIFASWVNGSILCSVCSENEAAPEKPRHMARTWDEFRGKPRQPRAKRD